jgi:hypothetical protein
MSHMESSYSNITVVQRVTPALRVANHKPIRFTAAERFPEIRSFANRWDFGRRLPLAKWILRLAALAQDFACGLPVGVASLTPANRLKYKTGAYSPPRFSAPALKASRKRENQAAHLLSANLFAKQKRVCKKQNG